MKKKWYEIKALAANGKPVAEGQAAAKYEISIHGDIGFWGVTASEFIAEFNAIPADAQILLSVHSDGGEVLESLAIYHVMARARDRITARVEGLAASAASAVIMAAGRIEMPANAYLMIHSPFTVAVGDFSELRASADLMEKLNNSYAAIYSERSGKDLAEVEAIMAAETWLNGEEAVAAGFADVVLDALPAQAHLSEQASATFRNAPKALAADSAPNPTPSDPEPTPTPEPPPAPEPAPTIDPMPPAEVATACVDGGFAALAAPLIRASARPDDVTARLTEAREILALAKAAGRPEDAELLVLAGVSVETARARLTAARADNVPAISPHAPSDTPADPQGDKPVAKKLDFRNIYAARQAAHTAA
ncbi:head maturation protease, ClpP-related [Castellaniella sp.]|uniref:head maturation protease, ClpP-related n=1 Tax=Castellaniella sp. TaxID=1955812 RepID=UPI002B002AA8|nr:head maturation protease, ClpP-related [Castellaniella sp.]